MKNKFESLSEKIYGTNSEGLNVRRETDFIKVEEIVKDVKEFIKIITEASDENGFDIMVEDEEGENITISFSDFIKERAGEKLMKRKKSK